MPTASFLTRSLYQILEESSDYARHVFYLDRFDRPSRVILQVISPRTAFFIHADGWKGKTVNTDTVAVDVLQNHIFRGLNSCADFMALNGQQIDSLNGLFWTVSLNTDGTAPCFSGGGGDKVCITKCDMIGENGIAHEVDAPLVVAGILPQTATTPAPTPPPTKATSPPPSDAPTTLKIKETYDMVECQEAIKRGDEDDDKVIRRPEFFKFLQAYQELKCMVPRGEWLSRPQVELFVSLACRCRDEPGAVPNCCEGATPFIDLSGRVVLDLQSYENDVCWQVHRMLGPSECTDQPSESPTMNPTIYFTDEPTNEGGVEPFDNGSGTPIHCSLASMYLAALALGLMFGY